MRIRQGWSGDAERLLQLDGSFESQWAWQMEEAAPARMATSFRQVRLPRPLRVEYPTEARELLGRLRREDYLLIAEEEDQARGYLLMEAQEWRRTGWVHLLAVDRPYRRRGTGKALVEAAASLGQEKGLWRLVLELQTNNYPAICFCQQVGFRFCGFSSQYYANNDIALFFTRSLRYEPPLRPSRP